LASIALVPGILTDHLPNLIVQFLPFPDEMAGLIFRHCFDASL